MNQRKKLIIVLLFVVLALGIAMILLRQKPNSDITISPRAASAVLDGTKKITSGKLYLSPGKHTITASFSGFATKTVSFTSSKGSVQKISVLLLPNSAVGTNYLINHPEEQQIRSTVAGSNFSNESQSRTQSNPLIGRLPYTDPGGTFQVDYGVLPGSTSTTNTATYITYSTDTSKQAALNWIQSQSVNPSSLHIIYIQDYLLSHLPYNSIDFNLSVDPAATPTSTPQKLIAQLFLTQADVSDENSAVSGLKQEVIDYIRSVGADPNAYTITYQNVTD